MTRPVTMRSELVPNFLCLVELGGSWHYKICSGLKLILKVLSQQLTHSRVKGFPFQIVYFCSGEYKEALMETSSREEKTQSFLGICYLTPRHRVFRDPRGFFLATCPENCEISCNNQEPFVAMCTVVQQSHLIQAQFKVQDDLIIGKAKDNGFIGKIWV